MMRQATLLTTFSLLGFFAFAQPELPFKVGKKTTGQETLVKDENIPASETLGVMEMQSLESGGAEIAETIGQLNVSPTGGTTYTIPIALPPGINGVRPTLTLAYNSHGGNGLAGWGWNVSGVSAITRVAATLFHDGRVGKVNFTTGNNGDRFALDGQRLLLKSGTYGAGSAVYETETYSNLKITAYGVSPFGAPYGPAYFRVDFPDGSHAVFGNSATSHSRTDWAITYWEDARGLRISYDYLQTDNTLNISKITYGAAGAGTPTNEAQFIYGVRNRTEQAFIGGVSFIRKKLLSEVRVFGSGAGYRSYIINHNVSSLGYNRLISVQEKSGDGTQLHAPVNFSYNNTATAISHTPSAFTNMQNVEQRNAEMVPLDYNGDGKMEFIVYPTTGTDARKKFWFLKDFQQQGTYSYPVEYGPLSTPFIGMFPTDLLYANGKKQPGEGITLVQHSGQSEVQFNVYGEAPASTGVPIGPQYQKLWSAPTYTNQSACNSGTVRRVPLAYVPGDFNGDGLTDVLAVAMPYSYTSCTPIDNPNCPPVPVPIEVVSDSGAVVQPTESDQTGPGQKSTTKANTTLANDTTANTPLALPPPENCCECNAQNVNGSYVYFINLDRRLTTGFAGVAGYIPTPYLPGDKLLTADADGDGKTDLLLVKEGYIYVYTLNQNNSFIESWVISDSRIKRQYPFLIGDYNGDGKADVMIPTADNSSLFALFLSTGTSFVKSEITYPFTYRPNQEGATTYTYKLIATDVDGDNKSDVIDYHTVTYNSSDNGTQTLVPYYNTVPSTIDAKPAFTAGSSVSRTGNLRHFPIPVFLPSDKPNVNLEFASASHQWVTYFQFKRDQREEALLRSVTQNGVQETIDYRPLEAGATHPSEGIQVYERGWDQVYPYVDVATARPLQVVQGVARSVNGTLKDKQYFSYKGAVLHLQGLGFLGFEGAAQTNRHTDLSNRIFSVTLSNPQLRGAPVQQHSQLQYPSFSGSVSGYISKTVNTYESELQPNKVFKLRNTQSVVQNALEGTTTTRQAQYDAYNNPTTVSTNYSGQGTIVINTTYSLSTGSPYYIGRPASRTETRTVSGQPAFTVYEEWGYNSTGLVSQRRYKGHGIANFDKEDFSYDIYGNLLTHTATPNGVATSRAVSYQYDASARFAIKKTDIEGLATNYTYHAVTGSLLTETNPYNQTATYAYDAWGRLITGTDIYGKQATTIYTKNSTNYNYMVAATAQSGAATEQEYDPLKRLIRESKKDALSQWVHVKQEYDALGRPWRKSEPYIGAAPTQWTTTQYDVYGRPTSITLPTGKVTTMSYAGLNVTVNDGTKTTTTTRNALGLVASQQDPGGTINYSYYSNGAMKNADYGGSLQSIEQDGWGRKTKFTDPSAGIYTYAYNAWSELTKETTPKGSTEYQYAASGKVTQKKVLGDATTGSVPTNMVSAYTYDGTTKLLTQLVLTNADGNNTTYTYSYDSWKRPLQTIEENPQARFVKDYTYDDFGRVLIEKKTAVNKANNRNIQKTVHHTYQNGALLRLRDITATGAILWELKALNARGQVIQAALGSAGLQQDKTYDAYGLPAEQKITKSGTELFRHSYTWNAQQGLLTGRSTTLFTHNSQPWAESFQYDNMDRLTQWTDPVAALTQSYDTRGRIGTNSAAGNYVYANTTTYKQKEITLNAAGQAHYTGHQQQQAVYNNLKQPVEIVEANRDKITFQYNAAGGRAHMDWGRAPSGTTWGAARYWSHYSTDGAMEITEDAQNGSTTFVIYVGSDAYSAPLIYHSVQASSTANQLLYLHRDYLGSIVAITDGAGAIKEKRHFDAWGNVAKLQNGSGANLSSFAYLQRGYTGHEHLRGVGLIHMNGRLYDPLLHRFMMPDNYVQDPYNSQNFNRYSYVLNNPLRYTDPTGEMMDESLDDIIADLWNAPNGGTWNAGRGSHHFGSGDEALGWGIGYMNQHNAWGGGGGGGGSGWASSAGDALNRYNGGTITPGMVEGYYRQQWAGQYYNIGADHAPNGKGFNITATFNPIGTNDNVLITYTSYNQMAQLMDGGFWKNNWQDVAFMANDLAQAAADNSSLNAALRMGRPTTMLHLPPGITFPVSTNAINTISKIATPIAKYSPYVSFAATGVNMVQNSQITWGDAYNLIITRAAMVPGWGLLIGGGALLAEGISYGLTDRSVSDNINRGLNGGVIFKW